MTSIVFDFEDIRSRMLGDDKPQPQPKTRPSKNMIATKAADCHICKDIGWISILDTKAFKVCPRCYNPNCLPSP